MADARLGDIARWMADNQAWVLLGTAVFSVILLWRLNAFRPGGLDAGNRDVKPIPAVMWLFASLTTFIALGLGAAAAQELPLLKDAPIRDEALKGVLSAGFATLIGSGLLWFVAQKAPSAGVRPKWADWPLGFGLFLALFPIVAVAGQAGVWVTRGFGAVEQDPLAHDTLQLIAQHKGDSWMWVLVFVLVALVPLVEELIYRVYLQSAILRVVHSRWSAVFFTSLLFAAAHWSVLPEGGKHAVAPIFVLSLAIGASYERTGRFGVPVMMHACFNGMNLLLAFLIGPMS